MVGTLIIKQHSAFGTQHSVPRCLFRVSGFEFQPPQQAKRRLVAGSPGFKFQLHLIPVAKEMAKRRHPQRRGVQFAPLASQKKNVKKLKSQIQRTYKTGSRRNLELISKESRRFSETLRDQSRDR